MESIDEASRRADDSLRRLVGLTIEAAAVDAVEVDGHGGLLGAFIGHVL